MSGDFYLRRAQPSDVGPLHELFGHPDVYRFLADGAPPPASVAELWVESSREDFDALGIGLWLLERSTHPGLFGAVRLSPTGEDDRVELTYLLHPSSWGRGLATRMAHTAMIQAFANPRIHGVSAGADLPNVKSIEVMKRVGMSFHREVRYPMGPGVEYVCVRNDFDPDRFEPLELDGA